MDSDEFWPSRMDFTSLRMERTSSQKEPFTMRLCALHELFYVGGGGEERERERGKVREEKRTRCFPRLPPWKIQPLRQAYLALDARQAALLVAHKIHVVELGHVHVLVTGTIGAN